MIIVDDMGLDESFCYDVGDQQARMPNVEAMCENGLVFENAYAAPTCPDGQPQELYNVVADPFELNNLLAGPDADDFRAIAAELEARRDALLASAQ